MLKQNNRTAYLDDYYYAIGQNAQKDKNGKTLTIIQSNER